MTTSSRRQADDAAFRLETRASRTDLLGGGSTWLWGHFDVAARAWSPAVDLIDREREVVVRADVPGLDREDIQVTVEPRRLQLRGTRNRSVDSSPGDSYHCVERWCGTFARTIGLPAEVDPPHMTATVQHGVLEVRLPKRGPRDAGGRRPAGSRGASRRPPRAAIGPQRIDRTTRGGGC